MAELTYLDMQARIARELRRSDLGREITDAIQDAIRAYKDERFATNVSTKTWTAIGGQREYLLPTDFSTQISLQANYAGGSEPMYEYPLPMLDYLEQNGASESTGVTPFRYALYGPNVVIYPKYDVTTTTKGFFMRYVSNLAPPDLDDDGGWWMNEAERMVRCHAKHSIFADVLYVPDQAEFQLKLADAEFARLIEQGFARAMPTAIVPIPMI